MNPNSIVGKIFDDIAYKRRITHRLLASELQISEGYLSNIIKGKSGITITNLHEYCNKLCISMADFFNEYQKIVDDGNNE